MKPGSGSIRKSKHWRYHHGRQIRQVGIGMSKPVSHKIPASSSHCWLFLDINATSTGSESTRIKTSRAASIASKLRQNAPPRRFMVCAFGGNNRDISIGETSQQNCKNRVNAKQGGSSRLELSHRSRSPDQSSWVGSARSASGPLETSASHSCKAKIRGGDKPERALFQQYYHSDNTHSQMHSIDLVGRTEHCHYLASQLPHVPGGDLVRLKNGLDSTSSNNTFFRDVLLCRRNCRETSQHCGSVGRQS